LTSAYASNVDSGQQYPVTTGVNTTWSKKQQQAGSGLLPTGKPLSITMA
jgi:hypothetical protein